MTFSQLLDFDVEEMQKYISKRGIYCSLDGQLHSVMCTAIRNHDHAVLSRLLALSFSLDDVCQKCRPICVTAIVKTKNPVLLQMLIRAGAKVNDMTSRGLTALHVAAQQSARLCKILLSAGANVNAVATQKGTTPLHNVIASRSANTKQIIKCLIAHGADPNAKNKNGDPVLMVLARHTRESVKILLAAGADVNAKNSQGFTLAHVLTRPKFFNSEKHLPGAALYNAIAHGLDVNCAANDGFLPWQQIIEANRRHEPVLQATLCCLYMAGAIVDTSKIKEHHQVTPLLRRQLEILARGFTDEDRQDEELRQFEKECRALIRPLNGQIVTICASLRNLRLPTLVLCEIIQAVYKCWARLRFCDIWNRVATVRHFR